MNVGRVRNRPFGGKQAEDRCTSLTGHSRHPVSVVASE